MRHTIYIVWTNMESYINTHATTQTLDVGTLDISRRFLYWCQRASSRVSRRASASRSWRSWTYLKILPPILLPEGVVLISHHDSCTTCLQSAIQTAVKINFNERWGWCLPYWDVARVENGVCFWLFVDSWRLYMYSCMRAEAFTIICWLVQSLSSKMLPFLDFQMRRQMKTIWAC